MNDQTPLNYDSPTAPPPLMPLAAPQAKWPGYVAWAIILLAVLFVVGSNALPELRGRKASLSEGTSDVQLSLAGKYAIGAKALAAEAKTQPTTAPAELGLIMQQIDSIAKTPQQRVRGAIIAGEMEGADSAIHRLSGIEGPSAENQQDIEALKLVYSSGTESLNTEQRDQLVARYQYLGQVAVTFNQPPSDPQRAAVLAQAKKVLLLTGILGGGLIGGGIVGVILLVIGIVLLATGVLRRNYVSNQNSGTFYVEMFAVYLVSYLALSMIIALIAHGEPPLVSNWAVILVLPITIGWVIFRGQSWSEIRQAIGWHGGSGWYIEIPLGLVGYLAGLPVIAVGFLITAFLIKISGVTPTHPILSEASGHSPFHIFVLYTIASVWAPIIEETMFRGALFHHMRRRWNWAISAGVVALIFATIHPQGWTTIPALASIAIVLAGIREWRGSILASMTAHGFHNAVLVTLLLLMM